MFKSLQELKESLIENGYEETVVLESPDYVTAVVGVSQDGQVIYKYDKMVDYLVETDGMTEEEAIEFIDYNTIRALPYMGDMKPIIMYQLS